MASNANAAESASFEKVKKLLGNPEVFAEPAGSDAGFPDYGFNMKLNGKTYCLQFEYKMDAKAQMGSMRDWIFDGNEFTASTSSDSKDILLYIMNDSSKCVKRGKEILKEFQTYGDPRIKKIYSGMLTTEKDQKLRRAYLMNYVNGKKTDYQLAKISDSALGDSILDHYRTKFNKSRNPKADGGNILFMVIGDYIFYVNKTPNVKQTDVDTFAKYFGVNKFVTLNNLSASLEVRIQPRGLSSPSKPVSIDVMASMRLNGLKQTGTKI
ncbi:hypothetical protein UFOVP245_178 [uncultured Caudovirales phage]|uniref:Uncharacterized protein n=1 Tax=uncultured Caudovirales phage TaxID=2100421 RepID=A0A6J7WXG5_9CAUD|nr:hypothetical protein UFOVP245_178 [uncultured Caudovirales phage]